MPAPIHYLDQGPPRARRRPLSPGIGIVAAVAVFAIYATVAPDPPPEPPEPPPMHNYDPAVIGPPLP